MNTTYASLLFSKQVIQCTPNVAKLAFTPSDPFPLSPCIVYLGLGEARHYEPCSLKIPMHPRLHALAADDPMLLQFHHHSAEAVGQVVVLRTLAGHREDGNDAEEVIYAKSKNVANSPPFCEIDVINL